jgi:hypothetical protein
MINSFKLGAVTWDVELNSEKTASQTALGLCSYIEARIYIAQRARGEQVAKAVQEQTLHHEVIHAMLDAIGYDDLGQDEKFVNSMGTLLHQFIETKTHI